jgi:hypothetical protein
VPAEGCDTVSILAKFKWDSVAGGKVLRLIVSGNSDMSSPVLTKNNMTTNEYMLDQALSLNKTYYWTITCNFAIERKNSFGGVVV